MNDSEFAQYLEMLAEDFRESGMDATADDFADAAKRIKRLVENQK